MFLLLLPLKVQPQDCGVEYLGKLRPFLNLLAARDFPILVVEGCRDFGFEEFLLLLCHTGSASPAFLSYCSRKSIFKITLYYIVLEVKGVFSYIKRVC